MGLRGGIAWLWACWAVAVFPAPTAFADETYPAGRSDHTLFGLEVALDIPEGATKQKPASFILLLHGMGDSGKNLIRTMGAWVDDGYVVCAPSARGRAWTAADLKDALSGAVQLLKDLPVDSDKVHVMGYSNGGFNLHTVAFAEELKPRSALYIASAHTGGTPPKWAKKRLGVLVLCGEQDQAAEPARRTVGALRGRVRHVEARFQPNLGHRWPEELMPYARWFMGAMEGRFTPGKDRNFDWKDDLKEAFESQAGKKRGGVLVYVYSDEGNDLMRKLQHEVFLDPAVRFYGNQIAAVRLTLTDIKDGILPNELAVGAVPAVLVYDKKAVLKKMLKGKIKARSLASALKSVAPNRKMPK